MNGEAAGAWFAIEMRERYGDVAQYRWPVSVDPLPDELLSSWIHRLALANGIVPRSFAGVLGIGGGMWSPRLDLRLPLRVAALLGNRTGVPHETISAMVMTGCALTPLLLPLRGAARRNRSAWMQYCSLCLADDASPYFRRQWRLASRISCFGHGRGLRDRCPACRSGIASFDQDKLIPQHFCSRCGFDLRLAPKALVKASARLLERCIDDICKVELTTGSRTVDDLVSRLLPAPALADSTSARSLTNLSTSARVRCFEQLTGRVEWLFAGADAAVARCRQSILAAGGNERLMTRFAEFMENYQSSQRSKRSPPAGGDLPALLEAYSRVNRVKAR
ncbi:MAG: hypothetical protein EOQ44_35650 [Mesorhizobium sp.]|uniref:TniQ family protein n=1 Tax=Mesorhizobium sp. TaxID=1871066 RepID=UPI000FE900E2|nr:TniQ family protein [Mesorhizobium sp.]RWB36694.1 MAG: hypothetical protein EOQ44_35650 [Mesorhizobium sp.]